ncbi:baseplate J/gp47 family protein [Aliarcobacter lanthieri]|uniref:baseplate J/gp47 family protein n=1 Tax=Aliarcobacter lanthieri TaxID=1355374 RepID=UPI003AA90FA8
MASYEYVVEDGVIVPDTSTTKTDTIAELKTITGFENMDFSDETPQGGIANAITLIKDDVVRNNAYISNQFNPNLAKGTFLDGIGSLTGTKRFNATYTMVYDVELRGSANTYIPNTLTAVTTDGNEFKIVSSTVIGTNGIVKANFKAVKEGAIPCLAGSLDTVSTSVLGLESITNPNDAVLGENKENDIRFRRRREQTLAIQGTSTTEAIISGLYALPGVKSLKFLENQTSAPLTIDEVDLVANSIWVCVDGGTDEEIARSIKANKDVGCALNGETKINIIDEFSGQKLEYKFDRPDEIPILLRVTVKNSSLSPQTLIPYACVQWANGNLGRDDGLIVGRSVSPYEIASAINEVEADFHILNIETSLDGITWNSGVIEIKSWQVARLTATQVTVVVE